MGWSRCYCCLRISFFFFFNDTATTEIYTLSLHDALPIWPPWSATMPCAMARPRPVPCPGGLVVKNRSEEHTSELQSRLHLVCRLLLEKKKNDVHTTLIRRHTRETTAPETHTRVTSAVTSS